MLDTLISDVGSTLTPDYVLMLGSRDITGNISGCLMNMTLMDNRGFEADQLDIELNDADGQVGLPVRGAVLAVYIGRKGSALACKGKFAVDEVEHRGAPDVVTTRAWSADFRGILNSCREGFWHDITFSTIVETVAPRSKLGVNVILSLAGTKTPRIN